MSTPRNIGRALPRNGILRLDDIQVPILDDVIPPILEGYVPHQHLDSDLEVVIPRLWDGAAEAGEYNIVEIVWTRSGGEGVPPFKERWDGPITKPFPFSIKVAREYLESDGTVRLAYRITDETQISTTSDFRTLVLDRTPPNNNLAPQAPKFPVTLIDEEYLEAHPTVDLVIQPYLGRRAKDRIYYYHSNTTPPPDAAPTGYVELDFEDSPLIVPIPAGVFTLFPSGTHYVHIRLEDRSGNRGPRSEQASVQVQLPGGPSELKPLVIPAMTNALINRHDARLGVLAKVQYDNWQEKDRCTVKWGNTPLASQEVMQVPFDVDIPWPKLIEDGLGLDTGSATYTITRAGTGITTPPSPPTLIRWDFTIAGQDHRHAPALHNEDLPKVTVWGEGSMKENFIDISDKDKRIYASVPLYHQPRTGQVLELFWSDFPNTDKPVATYTVDTERGDAEGVRVEFSDIPWQVIVDAGNHEKLQVYYTTFNAVNEQLASFTEVEVDVVAPLIFQRVEYPSADKFMFINCEAAPPMWDHIPIEIPWDVAFKINDDLVAQWQGYEEFAGGGPIASTADTLTHRLTSEDVGKSYIFKQSNYEEKIKPIKSPVANSPGSSVSVEYTVWRKTRVIGSSRLRYAKIDRRRAGIGFCGPDGDGPES